MMQLTGFGDLISLFLIGSIAMWIALSLLGYDIVER